MLRLVSAATALFTAFAVQASTAGPIQVRDAWSRPEAAGLPTAVVYMTLTNRGRAPDQLVGADSPKAARVGLHRSTTMGAMMGMQPVPEGLALEPGRTVSLQPNGYHLMLSGLRGGLKAGERYLVTLRFAHAAPLVIAVQVRSGADPMAAMAMPR